METLGWERYFPSQPANSVGRIWWMTQSAFNGGDPIHHNNGTIDYNLFTKTTSPTAPATSLGTFGLPQQVFGDSAVIAYSFDCLKGGEELMADGISVLGQAKLPWISELKNPSMVLCC